MAISISFIFALFACTAPASSYFNGSDLILAEAILANDVAAVRNSAKGVELSSPRGQDMTFLFYSMTCDKEMSLKELIRLGADPRVAVPGLGSPLGTAVRSSNTKWLRFMLDAGVSPNATDASGESLIWGAIDASNLENLKLLKQRGADLNAPDALDARPMYKALAARKFDFVEYLISVGADVNFSTVNGVTMANAVERQIKRASPGTPLELRLSHIKQLLIKSGIKFPADSIEAVRANRKKRGGRVVE